MEKKYVVEKEVVTAVIDVPEEEIEEFRAAFDMFDTDKNGTISSKEFLKILKNLGQNVPKDEADKIMKQLDSDGSGEIEFSEFISYMHKKKIQEETDEEEAIIRAFQVFDTNKDDIITIEEFKRILNNFGIEKFTQDEVDNIFKEGKLNSEGQMNYREFVTIWKNI